MSAMAITQRTKRKTAGQRMSSLVGKAQEEDDTFWGHGTWAEDEGSGNESFHDSDEDSELKKDEFDSDFDNSESDREEEEKAAGADEERELNRQERSKGKAKGYTDLATKRPTRGRAKRIVGDGMNAGIVLNFPTSAGGAPLPTPTAAPLPSATAAAATTTNTAAATAATAPATKVTPKKPAKRITMASTRTKRSATSNKRLRESTTKASVQSATSARKAAKTGTTTNSNSKKSGKRVFTQEELLLEAVHETEPANERWLLERKRIKDTEDQDKEASALRDKNKGPVIQKYHSKRGCLKTLTFPAMDSVPAILTRGKVVLKKPKKVFCVITGKPARYKDPKTNLGYFDLAAFKELRRRMEAKEPLDQRKKAPPKAKPAPKNAPAKAKGAPKHIPNGVPPTADVAPTTPKTTTGSLKAPPGNAGPDLPALSPSGRRSSPRSRKPSEKLRETIVSNPQLNNLVKPSLDIPPKPSSVIPDANTTKSSSSEQPNPSPPTTNGNGKTSTTSQPASRQSGNKSTSVGAKVKHPTPPTNPKTTAAASTQTTAAGSKHTEATKPLGGGTKPVEKDNAVAGASTPADSSQQPISQSQLIMQVINGFNKQHPEVAE
ncbi:MAG: hypothetical protein SGBAC_000647 [Bacillariaceae sp.]